MEMFYDDECSLQPLPSPTIFSFLAELRLGSEELNLNTNEDNPPWHYFIPGAGLYYWLHKLW